MIQDPVELVDGVGAEGVAHLGAVESYPDHRQIPQPGAVPVPHASPVVGDVREGLLRQWATGLGVEEAGHLAPMGGIEDLRDAVRQRAEWGRAGVHGPSVGPVELAQFPRAAAMSSVREV